MPHVEAEKGKHAISISVDQVENIANFQAYGFLPELMARFTRVVPFKALDSGFSVRIPVRPFLGCIGVGDRWNAVGPQAMNFADCVARGCGAASKNCSRSLA